MNLAAATAALGPPIVVTLTSTMPVPAGVTAVICVDESTVNDVAAVGPNETNVAPVKFDPVIVTVVPPASGPVDGEIDETTGAAVATENAPLESTIRWVDDWL